MGNFTKLLQSLDKNDLSIAGSKGVSLRKIAKALNISLEELTKE